MSKEEISQYFKLLDKKENSNFHSADHIVLLTFDDNYVDQTINLILSIAKYNAERISYICMCPPLKESNINTLLALEQGVQINCYEYISIVDSKNWPDCAMFRIFAPWLLDEQVKKLLYMDSDILCKGSLNSLLNMDVRYIAMCSEVGGNVGDRRHKEFMPTQIYCNSGVAVFNLEVLRNKYAFDTLYKAMIALKESLVYPDQDFLNLFYLGKVQILNGLEFDFQPYEFKRSKYYCLALTRCKLIHFTNKKPWEYKSPVYLIRLYLKHSQYPVMIARMKKVYFLSCLHSVVRLNRPFQRWYYKFIASIRKK